jgi:uncharacterized membrane protein YgcG
VSRLAPRLSRRRAALPAAAIAVALTFGLSACNTPGGTSAAMHTSVVQIAERAAAGDYVGALAELALLDRDVAAALDAGRIDTAREQEIRAAMELVRADLEAALAAATSPTPAPAEGDDEGDGDEGDDEGNSGNGNGGNSGNGGNNGNGNGNGNSGGSGSGESTAPATTEPPATVIPDTETPDPDAPVTDAPEGSGDG